MSEFRGFVVFFYWATASFRRALRAIDAIELAKVAAVGIAGELLLPSQHRATCRKKTFLSPPVFFPRASCSVVDNFSRPASHLLRFFFPHSICRSDTPRRSSLAQFSIFSSVLSTLERASITLFTQLSELTSRGLSLDVLSRSITLFALAVTKEQCLDRTNGAALQNGKS